MRMCSIDCLVTTCRQKAPHRRISRKPTFAANYVAPEDDMHLVEDARLMESFNFCVVSVKIMKAVKFSLLCSWRSGN